MKCPVCGSTDIIKKDFRGGKQRYLCHNCGKKRVPIEEDEVNRRAIVIPDTHYPLENRPAVKCVLEFIKWYNPTHLIHIGDAAEFASVSYHDKDKPLNRENKRLQRDVDDFVRCLNEFGNATSPDCKKVICFGNHEHRVPRFVERVPEMEGARSIDLFTVAREAGWTPFDYKEIYRIGKLGLFHGMYCNIYHARKHLQEYGISIMYGHTHDRQEWWQNFHGGERSAQSIGCLCNLNPGWAKDKPNRWCHGFASVTFDSHGNFFPVFHKIVRGVTWFGGKKFGG